MRVFGDGLFWAGCALRILVAALAVAGGSAPDEVAFLVKLAQYGPFSWSSFLQNGGSPAACPYGLPALVATWPLVALGMALAGEVGVRIAVLLLSSSAELIGLILLIRLMAGNHRRRMVVSYWLNPLPVIIIYFGVSLTPIAAALLVACLVLLDNRRFAPSAAMLGLAIAITPLLVIVVPAYGLYFYGRGLRRHLTPRVLIIVAVTALTLTLPLLLDPGFRAMVPFARALIEPMTMSIDTSTRLRIYLFPIAFSYILLATWRIQRLDRDMMLGLWSITVTSCLVLAPRSTVWTMLALPFLALHVARTESTSMVLYGVFSGAALAIYVLASAGFSDFDALTPEPIASILATLIIVSAIALSVQITRRTIVRSHFFQATRKPIAIGVGGDSGSGKDTLVDAFTGVVGPASCAHVSGDNYHLWDRNRPMWRALTHLDPRANDLARFENNIAKLADRRYVDAPHYDHGKGRMTKPVRTHPADFVVASGLHALWSPSLRSMYDVTVFLDIDEELRRFLKVRRDTTVRGHAIERVLASLDRRSADRERFILPQADAAELLFRLEPRSRLAIKDHTSIEDPPLRLLVRARAGISFGRLISVLSARCRMLAVDTHAGAGWTELLIEGDPTADDIAATARQLDPELTEFIQLHPAWQPGLTGVMQLLLLTQIDRIRNQRWSNA